MKHKRNKRSRLRGRKTCGYGSRKKHRGKGSKGGKGMAGSGKRADHLKTWIWNEIGASYWGKRGFKSKFKRLKEINLDDIQAQMNILIKQGKAKKTQEGTEINLEGFKILGNGILNEKFIIKADLFSKKAKERIEKAGGKAIATAIKIKKKPVIKGKEEKTGKIEKKTEMPKQTLPPTAKQLPNKPSSNKQPDRIITNIKEIERGAETEEAEEIEEETEEE